MYKGKITESCIASPPPDSQSLIFTNPLNCKDRVPSALVP